MAPTTRRNFVKNATIGAGIAAAPAVRPSWGRDSPNDRINIAVVGIAARGQSHYKAFSSIPNVRVSHLCDVDERLFPSNVAALEKLQGYRPETEVDFRKLIRNEDIDAVSIATPDYWHALQTIWACQAGKDVYVEKPVCFTIKEGRTMVRAARKYNRIVQCGLNRRSEMSSKAAIQFVQAGTFGAPYRARVVLHRGRASIGRVQESSIPEGVHWDMYLGPSPYRAFTLNRFHYGWHFFWDTSTTEIGNNGVHFLDLVRWGMQIKEHPTKIICSGGRFVDEDSDQEVPNVMEAMYHFADGRMVDLDMTTLFSPPAGRVQMGPIFYTREGYIANDGTGTIGWRTVRGSFTPGTRPDTPLGVSNRARNLSFPKIAYEDGPAIPAVAEQSSHFENFIDCVRSRKREDLRCEVEEGFMSTALCLLAVIAYKTGRTLSFNPRTETFPGDAEANALLTRKYREPYTLPENV